MHGNKWAKVTMHVGVTKKVILSIPEEEQSTELPALCPLSLISSKDPEEDASMIERGK